MPLTLLDLKNHIKHALGGGDPATVITSADATKAQYVNEAGQIMIAARMWKFLERPTTTLNFSSGVNYVALPSDLRDVIKVQPKPGTLGEARLVTFEQIDTLRRESYPSNYTTYLAISHPTQSSASSAPGAPRLEIYPTPAANITDALTVRYRAGWVTLANNTDVPNIPTWSEMLLVQLVRAVAEGYEKSDRASVSARVAEVLAGPIFDMAQQRDSEIQSEYGTLSIGQVGDVIDHADVVPGTWTVADPS